MDARQLAPGLWRWSTAHPSWTPESDSPTGWPEDVGSVYFEPPGGRGVVLVDPLVPADPTQRTLFWSRLDKDVARRGEVLVVVANAWHGRSAREILARYRDRPGCSVLAHGDAAADVQSELTGTFDGGVAELPMGVRAHRLASCGGGEVVVELPGGAGLVFADALLGDSGEARTCPTSWSPDAGRDTFQQRLRDELRPLLDARFERLLVSHGEPVLDDARGALERALAAPPKGA